MAISTLNVLTCKITIGDANEINPLMIENPIVLTEVENIEINESYKQLISSAKITFPKGTVFKNTIIGNSTPEGMDASKLTAELMQDGTLIEKRTNQGALMNYSFHTGQRINIKLGYNGELKNMFDGYIVSYNSDSVFELNCENMAYKLKLKQAPKITTPKKKETKVNDVCGEKYGLLKGTGFELHPETKKYDIDIGHINITDNLTVLDVLQSWSKAKLYCFLKYDDSGGMPKIAIGRPYSSYKRDPLLNQEDNMKPYRIDFDYHVAANNLTILKIDPKFLAVSGKALGLDDKFFSVTVRLNPEYDPTQKDSKEFQVLDATEISKKSKKITGNITAKDAETKTKSDLSTYTVVPYMSPNMRINSDQLVEECKAYFKQYNLNGISGTLTLFGDFGLTTAVQVELNDKRNTSKNGIYLVEEVTTTFGVKGYRQKISLPYKIKGKTTYGS